MICVLVLQTSAAEVEEARLKLQQAQAAAEAGNVPHQHCSQFHYVSCDVAYICLVPNVACISTNVHILFMYTQHLSILERQRPCT